MQTLKEKLDAQRKMEAKMEEPATHFRDLPDGMVHVLVPPKFYSMATAVVEARQNNRGEVKLTYEDGATETATLDYNIVEEESFFKIVDDVLLATSE